MDYGTVKTTFSLDDKGSVISQTSKYRSGDVYKTIKQYRIRVKVRNSQEEMAEYLRFTEELTKLRDGGKLATDKEDPATRPMFIIDYPQDNVDGSYFVIKGYTVVA